VCFGLGCGGIVDTSTERDHSRTGYGSAFVCWNKGSAREDWVSRLPRPFEMISHDTTRYLLSATPPPTETSAYSLSIPSTVTSPPIPFIINTPSLRPDTKTFSDAPSTRPHSPYTADAPPAPPRTAAAPTHACPRNFSSRALRSRRRLIRGGPC
jgi:hypothetical protein